jgi:hypothetical protein
MRALVTVPQMGAPRPSFSRPEFVNIVENGRVTTVAWRKDTTATESPRAGLLYHAVLFCLLTLASSRSFSRWRDRRARQVGDTC